MAIAKIVVSFETSRLLVLQGVWSSYGHMILDIAGVVPSQIVSGVMGNPGLSAPPSTVVKLFPATLECFYTLLAAVTPIQHQAGGELY